MHAGCFYVDCTCAKANMIAAEGLNGEFISNCEYPHILACWINLCPGSLARILNFKTEFVAKFRTANFNVSKVPAWTHLNEAAEFNISLKNTCFLIQSVWFKMSNLAKKRLQTETN